MTGRYLSLKLKSEIIGAGRLVALVPGFSLQAFPTDLNVVNERPQTRGWKSPAWIVQGKSWIGGGPFCKQLNQSAILEV
jgi:hypothetical protein